MAGRPKLDKLDWYDAVVDLMVREDMSFSAAAQAAGVKFATSADERNHERRVIFQKMLWAARNAYNEAIGANPTLTKQVVMGVLHRTIVKLEESKDYDKIATAAKTLSDIAGWTKSEPTMAVVGTLTQAEIDQVREKLKKIGVADAALDSTKPN